MKHASGWMAVGGFLLGISSSVGAQEQDLRAEVLQALKKAVSFYRKEVARHGGYVYYTSLDLQQRWGEGKATPDTIIVQPPGTPTVGLAYLRAHAATGDSFYLDAVRETAQALVAGQLKSGGWTQVIHFGPVVPARRLGDYRTRKGGTWNASSLDDDQTQSALRFMARADQALKFENKAIHEAALFGYDALLQAQFPNGAFPQVWREPVADHPVLPAKYPAYDWRTEGKVRGYWDHYTLNDNLAGSVFATLRTGHAVYGDEKYRTAIEKLGDFLLLAQMPDPQPGWCQQYGYDMVPIWARKFEPPALSGSESQDVLRTLIEIAACTGKDKYLAPIPRALAYFRKSTLPDGKVARFYELKTNRPLYMDRQYRLTYNPSAAPTHYGWQVPANFDAIEKAYLAVKNGQGKKETPPRAGTPSKRLSEQVRRIVADLDDRGRWITVHDGERLVGQPPFEKGFRYLSSATFSRNVGVLCDYLEAAGK